MYFKVDIEIILKTEFYMALWNETASSFWDNVRRRRWIRVLLMPLSQHVTKTAIWIPKAEN